MKNIKKGLGLLSFIGAVSLLYLLLEQYIQTNFSIHTFSIWAYLAVLACSQLIGSTMLIRGTILGSQILIICYLLQLFYFAYEHFTYFITTGPVIALKYDWLSNKASLEFNLFQIAYTIDYSGDYSFLTINLFSVLILNILIKIARTSRID